MDIKSTYLVKILNSVGAFVRRILNYDFKLTVLIYAILMAALIFLLKFVEYRFFVRDLSLEIYIGIIAAFFTILGVWIGLKIINRSKKQTSIQMQEIDRGTIKQLNISKREYEVLELIAKGLSNQEIADQLFISITTVKTHSSRLFEKLDVQRRTQAIHKAKSLNIIN